MEFSLHIITNGNRANISLEYDNPNQINKEQLKNAINDVVDCILNNQQVSDFEKTSIIIKDENIKNLEKPDYIKDKEPLVKYNGENLIQGATFVEKSESTNITIKNDMSYLSYIVVSQIKQNQLSA